MAPNSDPWRTLGLAPGATQDEIRRAYRRLAKINHPDAAGDAALPRFLAIQSAYEQLAGPGRIRRVGARPAARPTDPGPASDPREPWRADPNRARASGRADGRRTPGARPGAGGTRARPPGFGSGPAPGQAPGSTGSSGAPSDSGGGQAGSRGARSSTRRRPAPTAKPGSTSYEGADKEPFEPGWSGATWYGASSGTYWTINPKEYADPRKHGPEYQARARRSRDGWILDGPAGDEPADDAADAAAGDGASSEDRADPQARRAPGRARAAHDEPSRKRSNGDAEPPGPAPRSAGHRSAGDGEPSPLSGAAPDTSRRSTSGRPWPGPRPTPDSGGAASATFGGLGTSRSQDAAGPRPGNEVPRPGDPGRGGPPTGGIRSWFEPPADDHTVRPPLLRRPTTPAGRLAMALIGWPPLGVFASAAIDQSTGCGRYAASCPEVSSPGTWIVQAAIILLLLALPSLAAWSAHGAIAALVVGVPSAIVLSAAGGSNVRDQSAPILLAVLAVAYLFGVAYAVVVERRPAPR